MVAETPRPARSPWLVFFAVFLLACAYYSWAVRVGDTPFHWGYDLGGYYNQLGRAFALGQLHLEVQPKPELLALADPYDWRNDENLRQHDMVLFNKRYYLYHGAAPAAFFFAPFRKLTGHDVAESFVLMLMALGTYAFYALAFLRLHPKLPFDTALWVSLALAFANAFPLLAKRVWVYEIAIGGGAFFLAAGTFFLAGFVTTMNRRLDIWAASAGLAFGCAIACRPHLGFAGAVVLLLLLLRAHWRAAALFALGFGFCGLAAGAYNYARFGKPLEFGVQYLLSGGPDQHLHFSWRFLPLSLFYFLVNPPQTLAQFPWLAANRPLSIGAWDIPYPPGVYSEPTAGIFLLAPFLLFLFRSPSQLTALPALFQRLYLGLGSLILLLVCATGFITQRYVADFLPLLAFAALLGLSSAPKARFWLPLLVLPAVAIQVFLKI